MISKSYSHVFIGRRNARLFLKESFLFEICYGLKKLDFDYAFDILVSSLGTLDFQYVAVSMCLIWFNRNRSRCDGREDPSFPFKMLCFSFACSVVFVDFFKANNGLPTPGPDVISFDFLATSRASSEESTRLNVSLKVSVNGSDRVDKRALVHEALVSF